MATRNKSEKNNGLELLLMPVIQLFPVHRCGPSEPTEEIEPSVCKPEMRRPIRDYRYRATSRPAGEEAAERGRLARDVGVQAFGGRHPCGGSGPDSGRRATTISNPSRRGHRLKTEMRRPKAQREVKKTLESWLVVNF